MTEKEEKRGGKGALPWSSWFRNSKYFFRSVLLCYVYISVLPECMHMLYYVHVEARRGCQISWDLSYRQLWATCECLEWNCLLKQQVLLPQAVFPGSIFVPLKMEYHQVEKLGSWKCGHLSFLWFMLVLSLCWPCVLSLPKLLPLS